MSRADLAEQQAGDLRGPRRISRAGALGVAGARVQQSKDLAPFLCASLCRADEEIEQEPAVRSAVDGHPVKPTAYFGLPLRRRQVGQYRVPTGRQGALSALFVDQRVRGAGVLRQQFGVAGLEEDPEIGG